MRLLNVIIEFRHDRGSLIKLLEVWTKLIFQICMLNLTCQWLIEGLQIIGLVTQHIFDCLLVVIWQRLRECLIKWLFGWLNAVQISQFFNQILFLG